MRKSVLAAWTMGLLMFGVFSLTNAHADYSAGYKWNPMADWTKRPVSDFGTTNGNPDDDQMGNPVWSYEYIVGIPNGSGLGSSTPWYARNTGKMVWDDNWYGQTAYGHWVYSDNTLPNAVWWSQTTTRTGAAVTRWINPSSDPLIVNIVLNDLSAHTRFNSGSGAMDYAVVLDHNSGPSGLQLLYGTTYTPSNTIRFSDGQNAYHLPLVELYSIQVNPGESIFLSTLNTGTDSYSSPAIYGFIEIASPVPVPGAIWLLWSGLLGLAGLSRKRRSY